MSVLDMITLKNNLVAGYPQRSDKDAANQCLTKQENKYSGLNPDDVIFMLGTLLEYLSTNALNKDLWELAFLKMSRDALNKGISEDVILEFLEALRSRRKQNAESNPMNSMF